MEYREAINRLYEIKRYAFEPGLERTNRLLETVGRPETAFETVQIAGTNGKGSTAAMTAAILGEAGYRVGLYTSPHLEDVRERIRVNGRPITEGGVSRFMAAVEEELDVAGVENRTPTFFEATTAMALWYFAERAVDIAIVEVGIGGKADATSVVDPVAAAVTSVDLDHTALLGSTVEEIARDKAAIAPADGPFVTGATGDARRVVADAADPIVVGTDDEADVRVAYNCIDDRYRASITLEGPAWSLDGKTPLLGPGQAVNAGIAATLASTWDVSTAAIERGLAGVVWPGRGEVIAREPLVLLDGAHNPAASRQLAALLDQLPYDDLHLVFGAMDDKDIAGMVAALPEPTSVTTCRPTIQRAASPAVIDRTFLDAGTTEVDRRTSVGSAVERALARADPTDCVLITGSLYTVGEARRRWTRQFAPTWFADVTDATEKLETTHVTPSGIKHMRGKGVHRAVRARVTPKQSQFLKEQLLSVGGECATPGITDEVGAIEVVMMATLSQYRRLATSLHDQPYGLDRIGAELLEALRIGHRPDWGDWPWADRPAIMGILNITPDSFYDGGRYHDPSLAVDRARSLVDAGADIVDVGAESTRPGGDPISANEELDRLEPILAIIDELDAMISIDTRKASVAEAAIDAGVDMVNDVSGLSDPAMIDVVADADVPVVLMHSQETPVDSTHPTEYDDVMRDVRYSLGELVRRCERAGIDRANVIVDPGVGFSKSPAENVALIDHLGELQSLGCPILIGHSHKSMFEAIETGYGDRIEPTVAATALAIERGADIVRVHDVEANLAAVRTARQFRQFR